MGESALQRLAFSEAEYRGRVQQVQAALAAHGLDAFLCHTFPSICYLTGFETIGFAKYALALIPAAGEPTLLCQAFEAPNALLSAWLDDVVTYPTDGDPIAATRDLLRERGWANRRLGIEHTSPALRADHFLRLRAAMPEAAWVDAGGTIERVKVIKSPAEIAYIRQAGALSVQGMQAALDAAAAGKTDNDLARIAYEVMIGGGSEYMCYAPIVTVGPRSGVPHSTHQRVPIRHGDAVFLEFGACIRRYSAPIMRAAVIGPPSDLLRRMAAACDEAVSATIAHLKPGAVASAVAAQATKALRGLPAGLIWHGRHAYAIGLGFPPEWSDGGKGVGLDSDLILQAGMVFHVTTSLRETGCYGVAVGNTVVVTQDGCEVLTPLPQALVVKA